MLTLILIALVFMFAGRKFTNSFYIKYDEKKFYYGVGDKLVRLK
jgi:hypothetical protein